MKREPRTTEWDTELFAFVRPVGRLTRMPFGMYVQDLAAWDGRRWSRALFSRMVSQWNEINEHEGMIKLKYEITL